MFYLFFIISEVPTAITVLIGFCTLLAGVIVTVLYYKSGLADKKASGYKDLFELEEKKSKKYEADFKESEKLREREAAEHLSLQKEYAALSQLYAKKSVLLEFFTAYAGRTVKLIESGDYTVFNLPPNPQNNRDFLQLQEARAKESE